MSQAAVDDLIALLDLERLEVNLFRGVSPGDDRQRVFGGQVAGQALVAASRTVDDGIPVHSLHAYFLRPGDPRVPIVYEVDRSRDGRSFVTRRVVAIQHGRTIFHLQASFHWPEEGLTHQRRMPEVPGPETLPSFLEWAGSKVENLGGRAERPAPIDLRPVGPPAWSPEHSRRPHAVAWIRAAGRLPDDPVLHTCVAAYASDLTLLDVSLAPHGRSWIDGTVMMASLDHAMWFHRPLRADEWLLYEIMSPSASGGLGLSAGAIFTADGVHAVTCMQEGLIRPLAQPQIPPSGMGSVPARDRD